jgi:hypothetical protein
MRTVRRQGLTFRITQPHGLRIAYLLMPPGLNKGRNQIFSGAHGILVEPHCELDDAHTSLRKASDLQDLRVGIAGDDFVRAPHTRARPRASRGSSGGFGCVSSRYSMIASDSNRIGPSPSIKALRTLYEVHVHHLVRHEALEVERDAGSAIIGLTARYAASRTR